ncbi:MAG TPA: diguanylate cyclase [Polyangiaceae bacterium]|nr:diguanylate cyclase [Polyangiaceae bacterium]
MDDDDAARGVVATWLRHAGMQCIEAPSGGAALQATADAPILDAIVLDIMMPGMDGFEVLKQLRGDPRTADVPVLMLTAHATDEASAVRGIEQGAADFVTKPFSGPLLVAKLRALCVRTHAERELRRHLAAAQDNALVDALTLLRNRRAFDMYLEESVAHCARHREALSVVLLDVDHFKSINDSYGHECGDRVLAHLAEVVRESVRCEDSVFRYGGEEFVIVLRGCAAPGAMRVADRARAALAGSPLDVGTAERVFTFSAGIAVADASNGFSGEGIVARADAALYRAKKAGRNRTELAAEPTAVARSL